MPQKSPLIRLFNSSERRQIIECFLSRHYTTISVEGLQEATGLEEKTIKEVCEILVECDIITNKGDNKYELTDSEIATLLGRTRTELITKSQSIPP